MWRSVVWVACCGMRGRFKMYSVDDNLARLYLAGTFVLSNIGLFQGARWSGPLVLRPKPVQIEAIPMVRGPSEVLTGPTNLDRSRTTGPTLS